MLWLCWAGSATGPADVLQCVWLRSKEVWRHAWDFQDHTPESSKQNFSLFVYCSLALSAKEERIVFAAFKLPGLEVLQYLQKDLVST